MSSVEVLNGSRTRRAVAAAVSGVALALAFPGAALWPLALIALAPLIAAARNARSWREAFLLGELALTITWLINVPWVVFVMAYYGQLGTVTGVLIFIALALVLGVYGALFAVLVYLARPDARFVTWLPVPLLWTATEVARSVLLTGFPWNLLGTTVIDVRPLAMLSSLAGPYALGALLAFFSTVVAYQFSGVSNRSRLVSIATAFAVLIVAFAVGGFMLESRQRSLGEPTASAALLQPNIAQEMRWDARQLLDIFERMAQMTDAATEKKVDAIIWPESTVPLTYVRTDFFRDYVESTSRKANVDIILGSVAEDEADPSRIWNAAYLVSNGETKGRYDKIRLVPFGEYVPLRKFLFFAEKLVHQVGEFQFGANDHPLSGRFHYGPAICYEVVFPRITAKQIENGADVLVTVTNDAWFGRSAAPEQHLAQARMRAIEGDRYLLRAATTGISAVVDPTGRVVQSQPLGTQGTIVARFSPRHSKTAYVRFGDWFAAAAVLGSVVVLFVRRRR